MPPTPDPADLTTYDVVKAWCGLATSNTTDDVLFGRLTTAASVAVQNYIGRTIKSQQYTETRNGRGKAKMFLANAPVTAITSVTVDGSAIPAAPAPGTPGSGYRFDTLFVYLDGYTFNVGVQNVTVVYTAGYASIPADLAQAVVDIAAFLYKNKDRIGEASKVIAQQTVAFMRDVGPGTLRTLDQYRRTIEPAGVR